MVQYKKFSMDNTDCMRKIWRYENYRYCVSYHLFGSLMPVYDHCELGPIPKLELSMSFCIAN